MFKIKLILVCMALLLSACTAINPTIRSNANPDMNLAQFKTFGFFEPLDTDNRYESLLSQYLKKTTTTELEKRGFSFTQHKPDLLINFHNDITDKSEIRQIPRSAGGYYRYRGRLYYDTWMEFEPYVDSYQEGALMIDIVDREQNKMIWQGIAIGRTSSQALSNLEETIPRVVTDIFSQFPIKMKSVTKP